MDQLTRNAACGRELIGKPAPRSFRARKKISRCSTFAFPYVLLDRWVCLRSNGRSGVRSASCRGDSPVTLPCRRKYDRRRK